MLDVSEGSLVCPLTFFKVVLCKDESSALTLPWTSLVEGLCLLWVLLESPLGLEIISMSEDVVVSNSSPKQTYSLSLVSRDNTILTRGVTRRAIRSDFDQIRFFWTERRRFPVDNLNVRLGADFIRTENCLVRAFLHLNFQQFSTICNSKWPFLDSLPWHRRAFSSSRSNCCSSRWWWCSSNRCRFPTRSLAFPPTFCPKSSRPRSKCLVAFPILHWTRKLNDNYGK